jgi:virulence-associated protein VagC
MFWDGDSQIVLLPPEIAFEEGAELEISRIGDVRLTLVRPEPGETRKSDEPDAG